MKRVAQLGLYAGIPPFLLWITCEALGITVGVEALVGYLVVTFAVASALDFLERRLPSIWIVSAGVATATVIVCWTGLEIVELNMGVGPYVVLFVTTFLVHYFGLRRSALGVSAGEDDWSHRGNNGQGAV